MVRVSRSVSRAQQQSMAESQGLQDYPLRNPIAVQSAPASYWVGREGLTVAPRLQPSKSTPAKVLFCKGCNRKELVEVAPSSLPPRTAQYLRYGE